MSYSFFFLEVEKGHAINMGQVVSFQKHEDYFGQPGPWIVFSFNFLVDMMPMEHAVKIENLTDVARTFLNGYDVL